MKRIDAHAVLLEFRAEAFLNAVRLYRDACTLYVARAYPSSFALAVLAYEELGKAFYLGRVCDNAGDNPESADWWYDAVFNDADSPLKDHNAKQRDAYYSAHGFWRSGADMDPIGARIRESGLDREKQQALYVEVEAGRVGTPARIAGNRVYQFLKHVASTFDAPIGVNDWAFQDADAVSSARSVWVAAEQLNIVREAFSRCPSPS